MKNYLMFCLWLLLPLLAGLPPAAQAQNPRFDPAFRPTELYRPGTGRQIVVQPDGKVLLLGYFSRINGTLVPGLVRLLANDQLDAAFQANVAGLTGQAQALALLPSGKILLHGYSTLQLGSVSRRHFLLLNADGTPDGSFDAGTGLTTAAFLTMIGQPDGKIVLAGYLPRLNGQTVGNIVRLNANGTLDAAFTAAGTGLDDTATDMALQPDGKILVGGRFATVHGQARGGLGRLLPSGALDTGFLALRGDVDETYSLGLLPNGNIMLLGSGLASALPLARLLPNGNPDPVFNAGAGTNPPLSPFAEPSLLVLASGNVLVSSGGGQYNGAAVGSVFRVLPSGARDPGFTPGLDPNGAFYATPLLAELPTGQVLLTGADLLPTGARTTVGLVRLAANGTFDATFNPNPVRPGTLADVARQPNGQLLVGGDFTEINGTPAGNVARLNANGTVAAAFAAAAAADGQVTKVLLQPDGRVLLAGYFERVGGGAQRTLARLLPTGTRDAAFAPPLAQTQTGNFVTALALQPNGQVLLAGGFRLGGPLAGQRSFVRLNGTTGSFDGSFQPRDTAFVNALLVRPTGQIVATGSRVVQGQAQAVWQLLPSGADDPGFASELLPAGNGVGSTSYGQALARNASGELYVARSVLTATSAQPQVVRLLPNGSTDPTFQTSLGRGFASLDALAVQPNGRVLLGGGAGFGANTAFWRGSLRLLPNGVEDVSYDPTNGPARAVTQIVVQPDGAIVMAGNFSDVAGLPFQGLVRLLDPNVLALRPGAALAAGLRAWPVPARDELHLRFEGSAAPVHQVELLDALGRAVLRRAVAGATATLPLAGVPPGVYVLRHVAHGEATGSRRVVVE